MRGKWIFGKLKADSGSRLEEQALRYLLFSLAWICQHSSLYTAFSPFLSRHQVFYQEAWHSNYIDVLRHPESSWGSLGALALSSLERGSD